MSWSVEAFVLFFAGASSRMPRSVSFVVSPDCQRLLQRTIEGGMGLFARQAPLAYSKKLSQGFTLRSMSPRSTPCNCFSCATAGIASSNARVRILARRMRRTPREDFSFAILQTCASAEREPPIVPDRCVVFQVVRSSALGETVCDRGVAALPYLPLCFFSKTCFQIVGSGHEFAFGYLLIRRSVITKFASAESAFRPDRRAKNPARHGTRRI